jgi:recombination protein RecA
MSSATQLRARIEADLAHRIPSALTPQAKQTCPVAPTGVREIDDLLHGGFPIGAITELVGQECSGRTSLALSLLAQKTREGSICAWVDVSDTLHPESAAAMGVDLTRLLWVRCPATQKKSWSRLDQGLRVADLLLHAGGFSCLVLDLGGLEPEYASRVPLATWFRFRAAVERGQSNLVLLTQHASAKSSAGLVLHLTGTSPLAGERVLHGLEHQVELTRQRFAPDNLLPLRKPVGRVSSSTWQAKPAWAGERR